MPGPNGERCDHCYYAVQLNQYKGVCKRYPPIHITHQGLGDWGNPRVEPFEDWCGEYRPCPETVETSS